jgi:gamma-glutamylputrescine oxidase
MSSSLELSRFGLPFWLDLPRPSFPTFDRDISVDSVVIGAGIAGLKIARSLGRHGSPAVVLEGSRVGEGASARNQGTVNHSPGMPYPDCIQKNSREVARRLWQLGLENHRLLREQIDEYQIDCDYQVDGMTSLVRRDVPGWEELLESYRAESELLRSDGFDVTLLDEREASKSGGSDLFVGGLRYESDAQFHSGKYVLGLACGVDRLDNISLYEDVRVQDIQRSGAQSRVITNRGVVTTERVFLATNALAPQFVRHLDPSLRAERGQVLVTQPLDERPCRGSFGTSQAWWREIIEPDGRFRFLFGGGRERDEPDSLLPQFQSDGAPHPQLETDGFRPSLAHQERLETQLAILFPHLRKVGITHRWGGLQSFTADSVPKIGLFDAERRIYGIAGFCGRGNCHSDVGAEHLVSMALGLQASTQECFADLIESLMSVDRASADWAPWKHAFS